MTTECKKILNYLGCEYELFENEENDERLQQRFNDLTIVGKIDGFIPLIITPSVILAEQMEDIEEHNREQIIAEAGKINVQSFFENRLADYMQGQDISQITGKFLDCQPSHCFYSYMNGVVPAKEILIAKIPAIHPWELAAWIPMGGFNDCPFPEEQVAVFKYWFENYGAVPASVTYDVWEMKIQSPVTTQEAAKKLAEEHFAFCSDIVFQVGEGWDSILGRASIIKDSTIWYFWWD